MVPPVTNSTGTPVSCGEFLGDGFGDEIAPAAAPDADDEFVLRMRGYGDGKGKECKQETFHVQILYSLPAADKACRIPPAYYSAPTNPARQ